MSKPTAEVLKQEGNRHFQTGDYVGAEAYYSKAIINDPKEPTLYTNRAMARLRMSLWDRVVEDCEACLKLSPDSMKAHYYLAQAHLALQDYEEALTHALRAHGLCSDKSLEAITQLVLKCKKERWEACERKRRRQDQDLEEEVVALLERERDDALRDTMDVDGANGGGEGGDAGGGSKNEIETEWEQKIDAIRRVFDRARVDSEKRRKVPDWAIDDISFGIMIDPVITKTGKSYERASITEHLRRQQTDPITRHPLYIEDLRPNLDLKQACEELIEDSGWMVDY